MQRKDVSMRKVVLWCLMVTLLIGSVGMVSAQEVVSFGEETSDEIVSFGDGLEDAAGSAEPVGIQPGTEVVVGTATELNGIFGMDLFGNNTADMDVRALLHNYDVIAMSNTEGLGFNPTVVKSYEMRTESSGSRSFHIEIYDDLLYNDGTPITVRDYVFSMLLCGSPYIQQMGGTPQTVEHIKGGRAYQRGETDVLQGLRIISEYEYAIAVPDDYLPYFYGLALLSARPTPISVIAPGCEVRDDGDGAYISGDGFTLEAIYQTLFDPQTGYVFYPKVTSGPYSLESFDEEACIASFVANPYFKGDYTGQTPHIERLVYKHVDSLVMVDELRSGNVDFLNKVVDAQNIAQGQALIAAGEPIRQQSYLRSGLAFLAFSCEQSPSDSQAVRRAVTMAIDKDALIDDETRNTMLRTYGYYGLGQWMATYTSEDGSISAADSLQMLDVPVDVAGAQQLMDTTEWNLNETGSAYTVGVDTVRYRNVDGALEPLTFRFAYATDNVVSTKVIPLVQAGMTAIGAQFEPEEIPFPELLEHYYRQRERTYDMFFMASNFNYLYDPYYEFNAADEYQGLINASGLQDVELMNLALEMRKTTANDLDTYIVKFLAFQERFAQLMPMIPLYSNVYVDFYADWIQGYNLLSGQTWSQAMLYAYVGE